MLVMVPTVLVVGFWLSRLSAITMEEAIEKSTRAMRLAAQNGHSWQRLNKICSVFSFRVKVRQAF